MNDLRTWDFWLGLLFVLALMALAFLVPETGPVGR